MKIPHLNTKDILEVNDLTKEEILSIFQLASKLKKTRNSGKLLKPLKNKTLAMIFEKNSTRTRVSFEAGMYELGGLAMFLSSNDIQLGRGETFADTAKVLSRYVDGIMIRTDQHSKVVEIAKESSIPVINGLTDDAHPCQALTDYFTIYERGNLEGTNLVYIGDGNNMAHSLLLGAAILGVNITAVCPRGYQPDLHVVETAIEISRKTGSSIAVTTSINDAVVNCDYLYTDVWTSMGQEKEAAKRKKAFSKYRITAELMRKCPAHCKVMHCLPAHRGEEIDAEVIDSPQSIVFDQAENRLHLQKALLCALMK